MTEGTHKQRVGFSAIGGRTAKAEKIAAILAAAGRPLKRNQKVLDVGCGSGEIAAYLSTMAEVICTDRVDQRTQSVDLPFQPLKDTLPFEDATFDVVVSNHVIEHTGDPTLHLQEIHRVLRPRAVAYLATPNRLWPWEVHAHLPLLHYLPWRLFSSIGMKLGRLHEPVQLQTLAGLQRLCRSQFKTEIWHHRVLKDPNSYALNLPPGLQRLLKIVPSPLLATTAGLQPTLILLLSAE